MKKNIKVLFFIFTLALTFTYVSCTDENKFTNPVTFGLENGAFATFNTEVPSATYADPTQINFSGQILDPNETMTGYNVKLIANLSGNTIVAEDFFTATSFPADMSFTSQSIASALGIEISDIAFGDTFNFIATATREDGTEFTGIAPAFDDDTLIVSGGNTEPTLQNPNYKSAMQFDFIISCPAFVMDEVVGTYMKVTDGFNVDYNNDMFEIVAGETPSQFIIKDFFGHAAEAGLGDIYDVVVDVASNGVGISVERQPAFNGSDSNFFGAAYGEGRVDGEGLIFSCLGLINITLQPTVDAGSFGDRDFVLQKI
jgi:hypothetical protein